MGLLRDKTRSPRIAPLTQDTKLTVLKETACQTPANATHWSRSSMAKAAGISPSSVGRILRGAFASVAELEKAIDDYLLQHNASAKPNNWTKTAAHILENERCALNKLDAIEAGSQASDSEC